MRKLKISNSTRRKLAASVRASRRETVYKMLRKRHAGKVPCFVCGEHVEHDDATLEHVLPTSKGGTDDISNLAISHGLCNMARGNSTELTAPTSLRLDKRAERSDVGGVMLRKVGL